jgi:signal transduction histidine kinase
MQKYSLILKIVRSDNSSPRLKTDGFSCHKIYKENTIRMGGTGLGLAICKEIIYLHQGKIWAESNHNNIRHKGGIICFTLPVSRFDNY